MNLDRKDIQNSYKDRKDVINTYNFMPYIITVLLNNKPLFMYEYRMFEIIQI